MKKIGILVHSLSNGGAERNAARLSDSLAKKGNEVDIIIRRRSDVEYNTSANIISMDIKRRTGILKILSLLIAIVKVRKLKKKNKYNSFLSFLPDEDIINVLTKQKNMKTIVSLRNYFSLSKIGKSKLAKIVIFAYNRADLVVVQNKVNITDLRNRGLNHNNVVVINNFFDINKIKESNKEDFTFKKDKKLILNVGRYTNQKGQWNLIKAFSVFIEKHPNYELAILGKEYGLKTKLTELVKELNLENIVHFIPFQSNPHKFFKKGNVFTLTSYHEGFPNVLAEAMICKLPVISTDCLSGPREILIDEDKEYGILTSLFEDDFTTNKVLEEHYLFAKELELLIDNYDSYSKLSYERGIQFSEENIFPKWDDIL